MLVRSIGSSLASSRPSTFRCMQDRTSPKKLWNFCFGKTYSLNRASIILTSDFREQKKCGVLWWLQFFLFSHRFVYENRIRTHDLSEVQSLRRSSARLLSDSSDHLTAKRHWVPVHLRPVRDFSTLLGSFCCLFSGGLKWWHFLSFELEITAFFEFARSLHNPTSSKAVASPNDQCDGHGEHGEQHHLGTSGWTKNSSQKLKGSVPDEADVWILQGRQICQSQVACNLRSLGGSPFQAMKKSFRVQKFRTWGCKLVRYIQIRLVHPLGLTLTHQKMSLKPLSSYCRNENTHSQKLQLHSSMPPKLRWQADSQLLAPVVRPTQMAASYCDSKLWWPTSSMTVRAARHWAYKPVRVAMSPHEVLRKIAFTFGKIKCCSLMEIESLWRGFRHLSLSKKPYVYMYRMHSLPKQCGTIHVFVRM